ncbi:MAG TPA: LuxR C-terminal-related transcriptional regulator [Pirellulales bacterium]|nr:LuxR C-terminal-related transcriptional regulator [Pirellulales bacterium]
MIIETDVEERYAIQHMLTTTRYRVVICASPEAFLAGYPFASVATLQCLFVSQPASQADCQLIPAWLARREITIPMIVVTEAADIVTVVRAVRAGAIDVIQRPFDRRRLYEAVEAALAEDVPRRAMRVLRVLIMERLATLTIREKDVLQLILDGFNNKAIARDLTISVQTAAKHRVRVFAKMNVVDISELHRKLSSVRSMTQAPPYIAPESRDACALVKSINSMQT